MKTPPDCLTVTCPACGLLCDDITVSPQGDGLQVNTHGCGIAQDFFNQPNIAAQATIAGQPATLAQAIQAAAQQISRAKQRLFAGLGTDVQGMRAVLSLAQQCGAYLDHLHSQAGLRNITMMQQHGWQTTTLTEVKQRADLIVIVGSDIASQHPRFFERILWQGDALFGQQLPQRRIVFLGNAKLNSAQATSPSGVKAQHIVCSDADLPNAVSLLHGLLQAQPSPAQLTQAPLYKDLSQLAEQLREAKYSVLTWSAKQLSMPHADLVIQQITQCVAALNQTTRSSALPLGGSDGDYSVYQVNTWQTGYPIRNRLLANPDPRQTLAHGNAAYDPYHFSAEQLNAECDLLLWISCFNPIAPPPKPATAESQCRIVIGHPALHSEPADIFIPVRIAGLQQAGTLFRMDSSVSLPIHAPRASDLASLASVLQQIQEACRVD